MRPFPSQSLYPRRHRRRESCQGICGNNPKSSVGVLSLRTRPNSPPANRGALTSTASQTGLSIPSSAHVHARDGPRRDRVSGSPPNPIQSIALERDLTLKMKIFVPLVVPYRSHLLVVRPLLRRAYGGHVRQNVKSVKEYSDSLVVGAESGTTKARNLWPVIQSLHGIDYAGNGQSVCVYVPQSVKNDARGPYTVPACPCATLQYILPNHHIVYVT